MPSTLAANEARILIGHGVYDTLNGMRCLRVYGASAAGKRAAQRLADRHAAMGAEPDRVVVEPMWRTVSNG